MRSPVRSMSEIELPPSREELGTRLTKLRPDTGDPPDVTVVVPVNAGADIGNFFDLLGDLSRYRGRHTVEIIAVVNNFTEGEEPPAAEDLRRVGVRVVAIPNVRPPDRPGEVVSFTARIPGIRAARSDQIVLFDADCRVPNSTALLDWYVAQLRGGARAAYTLVGFHDYEPAAAVRVKFAIHHLARWVKRNILRIPTVRGSNYAISRGAMLDLYDGGFLADDLNVGPAVKAREGRVAFSSARRLRVLTSGRAHSARWSRIIPYYIYRLKYNLRVLPVRPGADRRTHRERKQSAERYTYAKRA